MLKPRPLMPLPRFGDDWRKRWLILERGPLHRVAAITWDDDDEIAGSGATACGRFARLRMPGFSSRVGLARCARCCLVAGVPRGVGAPVNEGVDG